MSLELFLLIEGCRLLLCFYTKLSRQMTFKWDSCSIMVPHIDNFCFETSHYLAYRKCFKRLFSQFPQRCYLVAALEMYRNEVNLVHTTDALRPPLRTVAGWFLSFLVLNMKVTQSSLTCFTSIFTCFPKLTYTLAKLLSIFPERTITFLFLWSSDRNDNPYIRAIIIYKPMKSLHIHSIHPSPTIHVPF